MRAGGGKQKGASFERQVCRSLSLWVSAGEREDVFWRSAMSGGRATVGLRAGRKLGAQAGDLSPIAALGERLLNYLVVECKHYKDLELLSGVASDAGRLYRFWHDLVKHARKFGKRPLLIAKQNAMPTLCLVEPDVATELLSLEPCHAAASLPRWGCWVVTLDCLIREAKVPGVGITLGARPRRMLAVEPRNTQRSRQ